MELLWSQVRTPPPVVIVMVRLVVDQACSRVIARPVVSVWSVGGGGGVVAGPNTNGVTLGGTVTDTGGGGGISGPNTNGVKLGGSVTDTGGGGGMVAGPNTNGVTLGGTVTDTGGGGGVVAGANTTGRNSAVAGGGGDWRTL